MTVSVYFLHFNPYSFFCLLCTETRRGRPRWYQTLRWLASQLCPKKMWLVTCDTWHVTCYIQGVVIIVSKCQVQVIYYLLKIWRKRMSDWINEWMNDEFVSRTAPATLGLLTSTDHWPADSCTLYLNQLCYCHRIAGSLQTSVVRYNSLTPPHWNPCTTTKETSRRIETESGLFEW